MIEEIIKHTIKRELERGDLFFEFFKDLNPRERKVLELRSKGKTLREVGKDLNGLSRQGVSRIEKLAIKKMKRKEEIINHLASKLGEVLFSESEIKKGYIKYLGYVSSLKEEEKEKRAERFVKLIWSIKLKGRNKNK